MDELSGWIIETNNEWTFIFKYYLNVIFFKTINIIKKIYNYIIN